MIRKSVKLRGRLFAAVKSRDLPKGKARSSDHPCEVNKKPPRKAAFRLPVPSNQKLGQAERAGVLTAVGREAHPQEAEGPGRGLRDGGGDSIEGK